MTRDPLREETIESRFEATAAVAVVVVLQLILAFISHKEGWRLSWWMWLVPIVAEIALLVPLPWGPPRRRLEQIGHRRTVALGLLAVVGLSNGLMLVTGATAASPKQKVKNVHGIPKASRRAS